ncbi:MAG TPA: hypothetical protein VII58_12910, partial [Acidobacteriaceae bacterium]
KKIISISSTFDDFQKSATLALVGSTVPQDALSRIQQTVPPELRAAFDKMSTAEQNQATWAE